MSQSPSRRRSLVLLTMVGLFLSGCAAWRQEAIQDHENDLVAAGFVVLPATTPERQTMLTTLPPNRVSQRIEGEHVSYLYPDPVVCHCLYVGSQAAWARFQVTAQQRQIARDQLEAAQLNRDFMWNWGPWGGYGPLYY